jgi:hypothetical protein
MAGDGTATPAAPVRIGIYDSRAAAYVWCSSAAHLRQINELMRAAKAAQAAGETNRFNELRAVLRQGQDEIHREFFSTAPPKEALAEIQGRLPEIQRAAGVSALVSKWDEATLKKYPHAEPVDVTGQLVREFKPTEKQLKVIADIQKQKPLPLEKCDELIRKGEI